MVSQAHHPNLLLHNINQAHPSLFHTNLLDTINKVISHQLPYGHYCHGHIHQIMATHQIIANNTILLITLPIFTFNEQESN